MLFKIRGLEFDEFDEFDANFADLFFTEPILPSERLLSFRVIQDCLQNVLSLKFQLREFPPKWVKINGCKMRERKRERRKRKKSE